MALRKWCSSCCKAPSSLQNAAAGRAHGRPSWIFAPAPQTLQQPCQPVKPVSSPRLTIHSASSHCCFLLQSTPDCTKYTLSTVAHFSISPHTPQGMLTTPCARRTTLLRCLAPCMHACTEVKALGVLCSSATPPRGHRVALCSPARPLGEQQRPSLVHRLEP
jgi:hypothetical protein